MRTWIIGSGGDCDVVVAQPKVSRRHCRFTELADGFLLEDLGSSNGTYVNGERIAEATRVSPDDAVTLGVQEPMPWPPASGVPGTTVLRIGRVAGNDVVIDDSRISSHHARLLIAGGRTLIEDAGSRNGTYVNSPDQRVTEAIPLSGTDTVYFGSLAVPAEQLLARVTEREPVAAAAPPYPGPDASSEPTPARPATGTDAPDMGGGFWQADDSPPPATEPALDIPPAPGRLRSPDDGSDSTAWPAASVPWTVLVTAQVPAIAIAILVLCGRPASPGGAAIASTTFALALAAVWLGGSLAVWAYLSGRARSARGDSLEARIFASPGLTLAAVAIVGVVGCALLLAIVHRGGGLVGSWPSMFGLLLLTSAVGLSLGLLGCSAIRPPAVAVAVLLLAFLAMTAMGGRLWRFAPSSPAARVAAVMPTRWAFEGLLVLETRGRRTAADSEGAVRADDLVGRFFPAGAERMDPTDDVMALGLMLMALGFALSGLAAATIFIPAEPEATYRESVP